MNKIYYNYTPVTSKWESFSFMNYFAGVISKKLCLREVVGTLKPGDATCRVDEYDCTLSDCELLIHESSQDSFKLISYSEAPSPGFTKIIRPRNNPNDIVIGSHCDHNWGIRGNEYKVYNIPHGRFSPYINYDAFYSVRTNLVRSNKIIDKAYFRCTTGRPTETLLYDDPHFNDKHPGLPFPEYLANIIQYTVGLSIPCQYELAHRDMEYMSVGLPMMRTPYVTKFYPELIPDHHYISINLPEDKKSYRQELTGGEFYKDVYVDKFQEVKNNQELLQYIAHNAKEYSKIFTCESICNIYCELFNYEN